MTLIKASRKTVERCGKAIHRKPTSLQNDSSIFDLNYIVSFFFASPSTLSYEDTYNTLKYANRAKNIKSTLTSNTMNVDYHVSQYAKIIEELKSQVSALLANKVDTKKFAEKQWLYNTHLLIPPLPLNSSNEFFTSFGCST